MTYSWLLHHEATGYSADQSVMPRVASHRELVRREVIVEELNAGRLKLPGDSPFSETVVRAERERDEANNVAAAAALKAAAYRQELEIVRKLLSRSRSLAVVNSDVLLADDVCRSISRVDALFGREGGSVEVPDAEFGSEPVATEALQETHAEHAAQAFALKPGGFVDPASWHLCVATYMVLVEMCGLLEEREVQGS